MIRTTHEAALLQLIYAADVYDDLVTGTALTTARYEPVSRNGLGAGVVDLLFERLDRSCVVSGLRLDPNNLVTRERSAFVWPIRIAQTLAADRLALIEERLTPWLRSLARGRAMAGEVIRRYASSERFDRARAGEMLGAAPLERVMRRMAPFVYARRIAAGRHVLIDCADDALAHAVLCGCAASIAHRSAGSNGGPNGDRAFARAWYGVCVDEAPADRSPDVAIVEHAAALDAAVVIATSAAPDGWGVWVDVPLPAPLDLLFSFDSADAPLQSQFAVRAVEPELRSAPAFQTAAAGGSSAGAIVLALAADAHAMNGPDVAEAQRLADCLTGEGFTASIVTDVNDPAMAVAQFVHIFGATYEQHTVAFAQAAQRNGVEYLFDVAPRPQSPSGYFEKLLVLGLRAATDDAELMRFRNAFEERRVSGPVASELSAEEYARIEQRFAELVTHAVAVLALAEDVEGLRAWLPLRRVIGRGVFAAPEPPPAPIGHLVPRGPFALIEAPIGARSNALFAAYAAERYGIPLVITGACYDVEYLQTLRAMAPSAVLLTDPQPGVVSALYRRAAIWIDAALRPPSAAALLRACACGALPVVAAASPLARIVGADAPVFPLSSFADCATILCEALAAPNCAERAAALHERLAPRRDLARTFGEVMAAYARVKAAV